MSGQALAGGAVGRLEECLTTLITSTPRTSGSRSLSKGGVAEGGWPGKCGTDDPIGPLGADLQCSLLTMWRGQLSVDAVVVWLRIGYPQLLGDIFRSGYGRDWC
jgi:hypothetical protein